MKTRLWNGFLSLFFPVECEACGKTLSGGRQAAGLSADALVAGLCAACEAEVQWLKPPFCQGCGRSMSYFPPEAPACRTDKDLPLAGERRCSACKNEIFAYDEAFACAVYDGHIKKVLCHYKFGRHRALKEYLAEMLTRFVRGYLAHRRFDAVVAVPLDAAKTRQRGFNQSRLLSRKLAAELRLPDESPALVRKKSLSDQSRLSKAARRLNVRGCFHTTAAGRFADKKLLLVDDILTTGETASECARTLKAAGAESVTVLACARGA